MIGQYQQSTQPTLISPYFINSTMPYFVQQNSMFQQIPQNPSNIFFQIPFNGGLQYYTPQQQQKMSQFLYNNQQFSNSPSLFLNGQVQNLIGGNPSLQNALINMAYSGQCDQTLPLQQLQGFAQNLIKQDNIQILQCDNNQSNQELSQQQLLKNDSEITNQYQLKTLVLTQQNFSISSELEQTNPNLLNNNTFNKANQNLLPGENSQMQESGQSLNKQEEAQIRTKKSTTNEINQPQISSSQSFKQSIAFDHSLTDESSSHSINDNNNNATELKISSNQNSSKFIIFKERKSISQENLSSTQRNSGQDQKNSQEDNKISQESLFEQENLLDSEEISKPLKLQKEKSIDNKSRNFSKNLLKSFFKYTQKANSDNKRFLFNFKRYISSNKTNNELIIKLLTNSPYHAYFVDFLGQPATDWILSSKVQNVEEQMRFLELCRQGEISALKKRNHNKKKSLFSLRKQ